MEDEEVKFRSYFLGNLAEAEAEKIDLEIISGQISAEELIMAEDELIEEFLDEELTEHELKLFNENFLISDERRERLKQISLLKNYSQKYLKDSAIEEKPVENKSFLSKLFDLFAVNQRPSIAILTGLIVVLSGFIIWQVLYKEAANDLAGLKTQTLELNKSDLSNLENYKNLKSLSLFSGVTRSANEKDSLRSEELTENVLLRFALPPELNGADNFDLKIIQNEINSFEVNKIRAYANQSGKEIRLLLPKSVLKKGDYKIQITPENNGKYPLIYSFSVN